MIRSSEVKSVDVAADKQGNPASGTSIQTLIPEGPNFVLRVLTVKPGGHTPRHRHSFEHEVYVLEGNGRVEGDKNFSIAPGDAVFVPSEDFHCFVNAGEDDLKFICVVEKDYA